MTFKLPLKDRVVILQPTKLRQTIRHRTNSECEFTVSFAPLSNLTVSFAPLQSVVTATVLHTVLRGTQ